MFTLQIERRLEKVVKYIVRLREGLIDMNAFLFFVIIGFIAVVVMTAWNAKPPLPSPLPPIEPYSPKHIVDTFAPINRTTNLQLENLWKTEFAGHAVEWQGKVHDVKQTSCSMPIVGWWGTEMIQVTLWWDYKYMLSGDSEPIPISKSILIFAWFPLAEKNRLLAFSSGSIIKIAAKLPESLNGLQLTPEYLDETSMIHVLDAHLIEVNQTRVLI